MKAVVKKPFVPAEKYETVRHEIVEALRGQNLSAKDISARVKIPEKEAYDHLEHIRRSVSKTGESLIVTPAHCKKCGFTFRKRERLSKPGKCPVCRGEAIEKPLFSIE